MKLIFIILALEITLSSSAFSQPNFTIISNINFERDTIGPLDPLVFNFSITNVSDSSIEIFPVIFQDRELLYGHFNIEYKNKHDQEWRIHAIRNQNYEHQYGVKSNLMKIEPGEVVTSEKIIFSFRDFFDSVEVGSEYEFRINSRKIEPSLNKKDNALKIDFKVSKLLIANYSGDDKRVYEYVKKLPEPDFFYQPLYTTHFIYYEDDKLESDYPYLQDAEFIANNFSGSKFTPWINLYISSIYVRIAKNFQIKPNKDTCISYLRKSKHFLEKVNEIEHGSYVQPFIDSIYVGYIDIVNDLYPNGDIPLNILNEYIYKK